MPPGFSRTNPLYVCDLVERWFPVDAERVAILSALADAVESAHRTSPAAWSLTLFEDAIRLNVGLAEFMALQQSVVHILTDVYSDLEQYGDINKYASIKARHLLLDLKPSTFVRERNPQS